jgi:3-oxoacyl-[acyl-carrier protein] reductase
MDLSGKKAIVTGGSLGIGTAVCLELARCGADVAFTYRRHEDEAKKLAAEIESLDRRALPCKVDVSSFEEVGRMVEEVMGTFGGVDILVNNAGINQDGVVWKMDEQKWDLVLDVNLKGYFNFIRHVAPHFKGQKAGKIVNVTSINGLRGKFGQSNYSASKAGIIGLTKAVARELGAFGVNVNAVAPGLIETDMMRDAPESVKEAALAEIVLKRLGQPEEVAHVVAFLASELSRHVTGEVIQVSGGQYI